MSISGTQKNILTGFDRVKSQTKYINIWVTISFNGNFFYFD
nr:MAG TPA: hypothetical protein [Caudoviricetes sp.]